MADVVLDLKDRRPVWSLPEWAAAELRAALPVDWELFVAESPTDGSGDGGGRASPEVLDAVADARIYIGYGIPPEILEAGAGTLEWVHSGAAGVGSSLHDAMRRSSVRFTNSAGIHGPPMAETVVGMLLHFFRGLDLAVAAQREGRWAPEPFLAADTPVRELAGAIVGILGYGGVGREVARRLHGLGSRVRGLGRRDPGQGVMGAGAVPVDELGTELLHGPEGLEQLLSGSDALVVSVPDTPATRGLLSRERIRALPHGAVLVNVARGRVLDEDALADALRDGHLRGAALDVFRKEPLPADSPLWTLPNVLVTPHVSGVSRAFWRREMDLVLDNLRRFRAGEPLRNEVDLEAGY